MRGRIVVVCGAVVCASSAMLFGGNLTPPAGPVSSTMKPLDAIEPRVCVNDLPGAADAVHVINQSGQYYLTGDIVGQAGKHGILIDADNVSVDLNGFSLTGVPASLDGIHVNAGGFIRKRESAMTWRVKEGRPYSRIAEFGGDGIHVAGAAAVLVSGLTIENNGGDGVDVQVESADNGDVFVEFSSTRLMGNGGNGVVVTNTINPLGEYCSAKIDCSYVVSCMNGLDGMRLADVLQARLVNVDLVSNGDDGVDAQITARAANEGFFDFVGGQSTGNVAHGVRASAGVNGAGLPSINKHYWNRVTACGNGLDGFNSEGAANVRFEQCRAAMNAGIGFSTTYQPGQPSYGNITMIGSQGMENGTIGTRILIPVDSDFSIDIDECEFGGNGHAGGFAAAGLDIDSSGGVPDPARKRRTFLNMKDSDVSANSGDGLRVRTAHDVAMGSIRNIKAMVNGGSGVDVAGVDGMGFFDIAVNFEDVFCSSNGASGVSVVGATSGTMTNCVASTNAGDGIFVGSSAAPGAVPTHGLRIDQCFATGNLTGIVVEGENIVLRSAGTHNALANMVLGPAVFAGPSVASPVWTETKPYAWP